MDSHLSFVNRQLRTFEDIDIDAISTQQEDLLVDRNPVSARYLTVSTTSTFCAVLVDIYPGKV